jgi:ribulose-phosphate 3-epimerase
MEIIPAILPKDFAELEEKIELVAGALIEKNASASGPTIQIDICDGKFTPKSAWPYKKHDNNFEAILSEERGLPHWEDIDFEMDLMIADPELELDKWIASGAKRLVIHFESTKNMDRIIGELQGLVEIGIAIAIDTPVEDIAPFINDIDFVQCMGIAKAGFQGQPFDDRVLAKVRELKERFPERKVSVDGGVNMETAALLHEAGADRLIVGSAIFESENIVETLEEFEGI